MKLYYAVGACSLASHIALREAGIPFDLVGVNLGTKKLIEGNGDYFSIVKKGYVPALGLDDGSVITEGAVILQYIADQKPESKLAPAAGTIERVRLQEWLHFIATELQKTSGVLLFPSANEEFKTAWRPRVVARFELLADALEGKEYLLGNRFTVADAYAYYLLRNPARHQGVSAAKAAVLLRYVERIEERPSVRAALEAEGVGKVSVKAA